jgi:hypothetical protein
MKPPRPQSTKKPGKVLPSQVFPFPAASYFPAQFARAVSSALEGLTQGPQKVLRLFGVPTPGSEWFRVFPLRYGHRETFLSGEASCDEAFAVKSSTD